MACVILFQSDDRVAQTAALHAIEEGQWYDCGKGWRARADKPHVNGTQAHTHVYLRGNEVLVVNRDGTPSHGSDLGQLPRRVQDQLKARKLIEVALAESAALDHWVPPSVITEALRQLERSVYIARVMRNLSSR
jgi:hypothetical protein